MTAYPAGWLAVIAVGLTTGATAQSGPPAERGAASAVLKEMSHHEHDAAANPHLVLSASRPATAADSARGADIVNRIRRHLAKYRNVAVAQDDGFEQFLPNLPLPVYHFTNWGHGLAAAFAFDPAKPTSLLYRKNADGTFTLTGVMYTAPAGTPEAGLDARIPLALTRWHQHVSWCLPAKGQESRWRETRGGKPLFGPESPIATRAACEAVGGRFLARVFGWMVHVNAFESDDPAVIWGDHR